MGLVQRQLGHSGRSVGPALHHSAKKVGSSNKILFEFRNLIGILVRPLTFLCQATTCDSS